MVLYLSGGVVSGLRSAANFVTAPFTWTVNEIARPIGHMFAGAINYSDVVAQNQKLRYELGQAELRANERRRSSRQLQQLTTQLDVPFVGTCRRSRPRSRRCRRPNFAATVDISKGRDNGILVGMPVVANGGLVGMVIATTPRGRDGSSDHRREIPDRRHIRQRQDLTRR